MDFDAAGAVFAGPVHTFEDDRFDYGETRLITVGLLNGRMVVVGWTPRGADRHVFTMGRPMPASKPATPRSSDNPYGETDFAKMDAHVIQPHEYDELPELTDEMMARGVRGDGAELVRRARGRPPKPDAKQQVTLRLDPDVLDRLRASGPG